MLKHLQMAWCGLRGGHVIHSKRFEYSRDVLLHCTRCGWTALLLGSPQFLPGKEYNGFYMDETR